MARLRKIYATEAKVKRLLKMEFDAMSLPFAESERDALEDESDLIPDLLDHSELTITKARRVKKLPKSKDADDMKDALAFVVSNAKRARQIQEISADVNPFWWILIFDVMVEMVEKTKDLRKPVDETFVDFFEAIRSKIFELERERIDNSVLVMLTDFVAWGQKRLGTVVKTEPPKVILGERLIRMKK